LIGDFDMTRTFVSAAAALTLMAGTALAQTTTSTTTYQTTAPVVVPVPMPLPAPVSQTTTERTVDENGMTTDHSKTVTSGTTISPFGDTTTTKRTTETTTVR
jgi:hypothetical protein